MENITTGAGLGALGFWLFIASMVAVGVWNSIRKRDAQHETLRRIIESGQPIDTELTDRLLSEDNSSNKESERDMRLGGIICLWVAIGLLPLGFGLALATDKSHVTIVLGAVAAMVACVAMGLLTAARFIRRWNENDAQSTRP